LTRLEPTAILSNTIILKNSALLIFCSTLEVLAVYLPKFMMILESIPVWITRAINLLVFLTKAPLCRNCSSDRLVISDSSGPSTVSLPLNL